MKNIKPKKQNENDYNILLNLAKNLTEDLEEGVKLSCELINKNYIERNKHTFYQEYTLFYNPNERSFVFDQDRDTAKHAFDLICIFPIENSSFYTQSEDIPIGPGLSNNLSLFQNYYSFDQEDLLKINKEFFEDKEELYNTILTSLLNYNNSVLSFFDQKDRFCKKYDKDGNFDHYFSNRKLAIYTPLLSLQNKELCFIHYLRFLTEPIDFLTNSITKTTYQLKDYLDKNNNDIKGAIKFFLSDVFSEEELSQFINNLSFNKKEFSLIYKNQKFKSIFLINNEDREKVLKRILEDIEEHFLIEKVKLKYINLIDYFENNLLIPISDIYQIFEKDQNKISEKVNNSHLHDCIKFISIGCINFANTGSQKQLFELKLSPEEKNQIKTFLKRLSLSSILSNN